MEQIILWAIVAVVLICGMIYYDIRVKPTKKTVEILETKAEPTQAHITHVRIGMNRFEKKCMKAIRRVCGRKPWRGSIKVKGPDRRIVIQNMWRKAELAKYIMS